MLIWWSYDLYRGPRNQKPKVLYARSKAEAEEIAQGFLQEDVLGFDMEWPCFDGNSRNEDRLQDKVGLISIACETKIALFHLGAYTGKKPQDFIGPGLRAIIESPQIKKAGVNILAADFGRLRDWFELEPQGAVELSHLHNLDNYINGQTSHCTTRLCALDKLVQTYLYLPLKKSSVRTSNWAQKKQLNREQKAYAASDAYAGFMLYHCLNSLRLSIEPSPPPPPLFAERYKWIESPRRGTALLLELDNPGKEGTLEVIAATDHFDGRHENIRSVTIAFSTIPTIHNVESEGSQTSSPAPIQENPARQSALRTSQHNSSQRRMTTPSRKRTDPLLQALKVHRGKIAKQRRLDTWKVVHNSALKLIAQYKPENAKSLMEIKGVGPQTVKKYGAAILNIVALHAAGDRQSTEVEQSDIDTDPPCAPQEKGPDRGGPSQPIIIDDRDDIASPQTPSAKAIKRKITQVGPRHGLLRYFKVGEGRKANLPKS
ncbi:hypothetical protein SLS63_008685 [Diaporthe eres]|uniref:HRDC domain-containing protein n=1 Tax=Diaporthe eres TaxID=83184 RepID=A0ABR1P1X0_DIAER